MAILRVEVVSTTQILYRGEATQVSLPSVGGRLGILPGRAPLLAILSAGKVNITDKDGVLHEVEIPEGFVSFDQNVLTICVDQYQNWKDDSE